MHINNWVHASDLMKMIKSANSTSTLSSEEGLPDNHVITIRERELTVDFPELIQNNIKTDTVTLDLDTEWDGIQPVIIFGPNASGTIAVEYTGEPVHIPGAVMQYVGGLDCSVMGLDDSGEVRLVTKAAPNTFEVVESGEYIGQISEDDVSLLGQILSAIKDVETATSDASSAAEAATAAANSANTAATTATNAANSANTAATKATDAANSANTASERAENAYDALTPIIAEIGVNGNQPRATTNPNHVATASDTYAAKPLEICIKGNTRQNLWVNPSGTNNGVTVTSNADGSIRVEGTTIRSLSLNSGKKYILKPSTSYTISVDNKLSDNLTDASNGSFFIAEYSQDNSPISGATRYIGYGNTLSVTFRTSEELSHVYMGVYAVSGKTFSGTYRVMLNEGSTAQPWCPPGLNSVGDDGSVKIVTAGKNLFGSRDEAITKNGITVTPNGDGSYTVNGTATEIVQIEFSGNVANQIAIPDGDFVLSGGAQNARCAAWFYDANHTYIDWCPSSSDSDTRPTKIIQKNARYYVTLVAVSSGKTVSNEVIRPMMRRYGTSSDFEIYDAITITPIDLQGHTLNSLPDGTCDELHIDATGAVTLVQRVGAVTFDGSSDERWQFATDRIGLQNGAPGSSAVSDSGNAYCDTLPVRSITNATAIVSYSRGWVEIRNSMQITSAETGKEWLASNPTTYVYHLATPQTIPLAAVTLPTLPSPNITVYHDSDVPSDITVEYVQDINIVLDNLNAKIAALNIAQSISS